MKRTALRSLLTAALVGPSATSAEQPSKRTFEVSLYGLAAGMSGDVATTR